MRPFRVGPVACAVLAACAHSPAPAPSPSPKSPPAHRVDVQPGKIKRVVGDMPPGYEVSTTVASAAAPTVIWGLPGATATPPQCGALADPGDGRGHSAQGVSASGSGGIVNAIVVAAPGPVQLDRGVLAACGQWSMVAGRATAEVRLAEAPHIDDADTVGMVAEIKSSVESGSEIDSRVYTFTAYLGDYYAFTTLTTDPGSALPALSPAFAADLLVKTVSTLRG